MNITVHHEVNKGGMTIRLAQNTYLEKRAYTVQTLIGNYVQRVMFFDTKSEAQKDFDKCVKQIA